MNIIDDFIKPRIQDDIERMFLENNFPYFYSEDSVGVEANRYDMTAGATRLDEHSISAPQFSHMFLSDGKVNSQFYGAITPISNKLIDIVDEDCYLYRCKVNLNTIDSRFENKYYAPHVDNSFENQITAIYYVNDSDGDTFFFDDDGNVTKTVTPKKGRLVWWRGKIFHAKSSPAKSVKRLVINFNLLPYGDIK